MTNPTWTPATDSASLLRARASEGDFGPQRVYFYDVDTREELIAHPLNGMYWTGTGAMVAHEGAYVEATTGRLSCTAYLDGTARRVAVTAASFPGRCVAAKIWYASRDVSDWRLLAEGDGSRVTGQVPRFDGRAFAAMMRRGEVK